MEPAPPSLLARVASGDPTAVEACLDRYGPLVWSVVRSVVFDRDLCEDAVQEVFLALWLEAGRFDPALSSEAGFVALVARRRAIDAVRRRVRRMRDQVDHEPDTIAVADERLDEVETEEEVAVAHAVLAELRPEQQRVLRLSLVDGLSHGEIAERTGMPLGTVKTHARRGLAAAREKLAERRGRFEKRGGRA
jgi:RNA polymerase sigma-70 factor (ECF subfamily)